MTSIALLNNKKELDTNIIKKIKSDKPNSKSLHRKSTKKNLLSMMSTKSTLINSRSLDKIKKSTKSNKIKNVKSKKKIDNT
jgi:hypothetical protein